MQMARKIVLLLFQQSWAIVFRTLSFKATTHDWLFNLFATNINRSGRRMKADAGWLMLLLPTATVIDQWKSIVLYVRRPIDEGEDRKHLIFYGTVKWRCFSSCLLDWVAKRKSLSLLCVFGQCQNKAEDRNQCKTSLFATLFISAQNWLVATLLARRITMGA